LLAGEGRSHIWKDNDSANHQALVPGEETEAKSLARLSGTGISLEIVMAKNMAWNN
jgi:hypothetical protein